MVSREVAQEAQRILRGRPPSGDKRLLNEAIDFINEDPNLRRILEGGAPTGLSPERTEAFIQQQAFEQLGVVPTREVITPIAATPPLRFSGPSRLGTKPEQFRQTGQVAFMTREEIERSGAVSPRQPPSSIFESIQRRAGQAIDVVRTQQQLGTQFTTQQIATAPLSAIEILGVQAGGLAQRGVGSIVPEGITITQAARGPQQVTFFQPTFGTITPEAPQGLIEREVTIPSRGQRQVQIFEPSRVGTGVRIGTQAGLFAVAPAALIAPGLIIEGIQTARDPTLSIGQRLVGVAEAELGLLVGGLKIKSLVKDLPPLKIRELSELPGPPKLKIALDKRGTVGKAARQKVVTTAKEKAQKKGEKKVTRKEVEEFLEVDVKIEGDVTKITLLGKGTESFNLKRDKSQFLIENAKSPEARREALSLIKEKYGKNFLEDYLEQEGLRNVPEIRSSTLIGRPEIPTTTGPFGGPSVFAGTGQFEQAQFTAFGTGQFGGIQRGNLFFRPSPGPVVAPGGLQVGAVGALGPPIVTEITSLDIGLDVGVGTRVGEALLPGLATSLGLSSATIQEAEQRSSQAVAPALAVAQATAQETAQQTQQRTAQALASALQFGQTQEAASVQRTGQRFGFRQPAPQIRPRVRPPILLGAPEEPTPTKPKPAIKKKGFFPEVKVKDKWRRIGDKPRTLKEARAIAGEIVDKTTSAQLRLISSKKKAIKETLNKRIAAQKFRDFMKKGKSKIPLPNKGLIELRKFRIDTPSEKKQLSVAKFLKSKEFKKFTKPKKKKKTRSKPTSSPSLNQFLLGGGFGSSQIKFFQ